MANKDYYQILGLSRNASADEIKASFRRLARQYHPDVCKELGADKKFKEINEAYQVLGDPNKRAQYNAYGRVGAEFPGFGEINLEDLFQGLGEAPFGDIFETFFGRERKPKKTGPRPGDNLRYDLSIALEESFKGTEKEIEIKHLKSCTKCKGIGAEPGSTVKKCPSCNGSGQTKHSQRTIFGSFTRVAPCLACTGTGEVMTNPCKSCKGSGRAVAHDKIKISIPPGIDSGYRLRVSGAGDAGIKGGSSGDLYVFISVKPHHKFKRQGDNLFTSEKIDFVTAILGDEIDISLLDEKTKLKIPPGTQPNTVIRLRGHGMPHLHGREAGDLFVEVQVQIPTRLSKEQTELLKKIKGINPHTNFKTN